MWVNVPSVTGRNRRYSELEVKSVSMSKTVSRLQQRRIRVLVAKPGLE